MRIRASLALPVVLLAVTVVPQAAGAWDPTVAALQVGLHSRGLYRGPIDGLAGPATDKAIRKLQRRSRIAVDGSTATTSKPRAASHAASRPVPAPMSKANPPCDGRKSTNQAWS